MLSEDCHISLGGQKLVLKTDMPQFYLHQTSPRRVTRYTYEVAGSPGERTLTPHLYTWRVTDWSGGENGELNPFFDINDPSVYDQGIINPRIPGQIAGPPQRTGSTPTAPAAIPTFGPFLGVGGGYVWLGHEKKIEYSNDGSTWTVADTTAYQVTCPPCTDGRFVYFHTNDTPGGAGFMRIRRYDVATPTNQLVVDTSGGAGDTRDSLGIAWQAGFLYRWTGLILRSFDLSAFSTGTAAITTGGTNVFATGADSATADLASTKYGGCAATDNSIVMFYATPGGGTFLYEYKSGAGSQLSNFVNGFVAKAFCSYLGNVWLVGQQAGQGCIWRYDLLTRTAAFVRWLRRGSGTALDPVSCTPGPENQVIIGCSAGENFVLVWDPDTQLANVSLLDTRTGDGTENAVITYGLVRMAAMGYGATAVKISAWKADDVVSTSVQNGNVTSGEFNFEFPEETAKGMLSVHTSIKPITGSETVIISYKADGESTSHALPTITSATTGASTGTVVQKVSQPYTTSAVSWAAGSITYTIGANHLVKAGDVVNVYGLAPSGLNGLKTVASIGATTIVVTQADPGTITDQVGTVEYTSKFGTLLVNIAVTGGAIVKACAVQMYPLSHDETFQYIIDLSDHAAAKAQDDKEAHELAAILVGSTANHTGQTQAQGLLRAGNVLQLLDGTPYSESGEYDTYTVCIEQCTVDWLTRTATVVVRNTAQAIGP